MTALSPPVPTPVYNYINFTPLALLYHVQLFFVRESAGD